VTDDDLVVMSSEAGVLPIPDSSIINKWRLQPGKMFLIDLEAGRIIEDKELKDTYANAKPYSAWIKSVRIKLDELKAVEEPPVNAGANLLDRQQAFGYTQEDIKTVLAVMAKNGEEAIGSMGNDSPLAVMSNKNKTLYHYFKQLFAQVTNPPIDPIREAMVMSLVSFIGPRPNLLDRDNINPPARLEVTQPVLGFKGMSALRNISNHTRGKFRSQELSICYPASWGSEGIEACLASLCAAAADAGRGGVQHPDPYRPEDGCQPCCHSCTACHFGGAPASRWQGAARPYRPGGGDRLGP
jgi:glutamate synthase (NADPH/NADH) large chain